jgi:alpha-D-ribose 1-methylphosphonate 5-triphosphate synthase subunit PhnG
MTTDQHREKKAAALSSPDLHRAVAAMEGPAVYALLEAISARGAEIIKEPETGLIMMNVRDCFNTEFHLGEVLVTTAEVRIGGHRGWGMIMGDDGERALLLAGLDVILRETADPFATEVRVELGKWLAKAEAALISERQRAATTRVNFQTMVTE